jgi:hypothetical protein
MADNAFREVTSNNIPHMAIVRNTDELIDQAICQIGNSTAFFGGGWLMDKLLDRVTKNTRAKLKPALKPLMNVGKSFALFAFIASTVLSTPFLRNYVTTKRTGTLKYADMIGEADRNGNDKAKVDKAAREYLGKFWKTLGIGIGSMAGIMALTVAGVKSLKKTPAALKKLNNLLGLKNGSFMNFKEHQSVLFWVLPTYAGLFAGARDIYEKKELIIRFLAFNFAFFVFPKTVEKGIDKLTENMKPNKFLGPAKNIGYIGKLISSVIFCGSIPTIVNIHLTRQRVKRDKANGKLTDNQTPSKVQQSEQPTVTNQQQQAYMAERLNQFVSA